MNDETKLMLAMMAIFAGGVALVATGFGLTTKTALVSTGLLLCAGSAKLMQTLWRNDR